MFVAENVKVVPREKVIIPYSAVRLPHPSNAFPILMFQTGTGDGEIGDLCPYSLFRVMSFLDR